MKYSVIRTEKADLQIRRLILFLADSFGRDVALKKLNSLEKGIMSLSENPGLGMVPRYLVLKHQGYKVLIVDKNLVFYKVNEESKVVTIYAVIDQRQDYVNIISGL